MVAASPPSTPRTMWPTAAGQMPAVIRTMPESCHSRIPAGVSATLETGDFSSAGSGGNRIASVGECALAPIRRFRRHDVSYPTHPTSLRIISLAGSFRPVRSPSPQHSRKPEFASSRQGMGLETRQGKRLTRASDRQPIFGLIPLVE